MCTQWCNKLTSQLSSNFEPCLNSVFLLHFWKDRLQVGRKKTFVTKTAVFHLHSSHDWKKCLFFYILLSRNCFPPFDRFCFVKQGKFKAGVVTADGLSLLLPITIFLFIKWSGLSMSAGANPMNYFWPIWSSSMDKCILLLVRLFRFIWSIL
jgi:hypothetical protein